MLVFDKRPSVPSIKELVQGKRDSRRFSRGQPLPSEVATVGLFDLSTWMQNGKVQHLVFAQSTCTRPYSESNEHHLEKLSLYTISIGV